MADGREIEVWENYASQCIERPPIIITINNWFDINIKKLSNIETVVDIGCGPGNWATLFSTYNYIAFDQSLSMLSLVKKNIPTAITKLGNARDLELYFSKNSIDLFFSSAVLQHNRHDPDKTDIINGMYNCLRTDGYFMCAENTLLDEPSDGYSFTFIGWKNYMNNLGFNLIDYCELSKSYEVAVPTSLYLYQKKL